MVKIAIGSDHGGFELKEAIKAYLDEQKISYHDFGTDSTVSVDYAPIAAQTAHTIINGEAEMGFLCCGTGIGMSIAANKIKGIRAAVCSDAFSVEMTRRHNNANILCLGGRVISIEQAISFVKIFMETGFEGGRHQKRLDEITAIENGEL